LFPGHRRCQYQCRAGHHRLLCRQYRGLAWIRTDSALNRLFTFKLEPTGKETVLYTFSGGSDGALPLRGWSGTGRGTSIAPPRTAATLAVPILHAAESGAEWCSSSRLDNDGQRSLRE